MSGRPGSNRRHSAWKADALPTELLPHKLKYIIFFYFALMNIQIEAIPAKETLSIRHQMLRQGHPLSSCHFEKDNASSSRHWAAFVNKEKVGILSAIQNPCLEFPTLLAYQFRGMAVVEDFQRKGIASQLLTHAEEAVLNEFNPQLFWLNARVNAQKLYQQLHYQSIGTTFDISTVGPHIRYLKKTIP